MSAFVLECPNNDFVMKPGQVILVDDGMKNPVCPECGSILKQTPIEKYDMTPEERAMKTALSYFIMKEIKRHELDIIRSWNDIAKLRKQGIEVPDYDTIDPNTWIEA